MRSVKQNIATPDIAELRDELSRVVQMLELLVCAAREGEAASFKLKKFLARNDLSREPISQTATPRTRPARDERGLLRRAHLPSSGTRLDRSARNRSGGGEGNRQRSAQ